MIFYGGSDVGWRYGLQSLRPVRDAATLRQAYAVWFALPTESPHKSRKYLNPIAERIRLDFVTHLIQGSHRRDLDDKIRIAFSRRIVHVRFDAIH